MRIKLLTVNILHGGIFWDNLIHFIHAHKPDLLTIQEVYDGHDLNQEKRFRTMDEFRSEFGNQLPFNAFGATTFDTGANANWGNAVFSKYKIKKSKTIFFDLPFAEFDFSINNDFRNAPEGMLEVEIEIDQNVLHVYSWHGVWNTHGEDTPQRALMSNIIIDTIKDKELAILAGDTNMNPTCNASRNIENHLKSVFGTTLKSTFNMEHKDKPGYATAAVDMIFVSPKIKVIEKSLIKVDVSDHYPLAAVIEI